jgi:hypothetical protein
VPHFSFEPLLFDLGLLVVAIVVDLLVRRAQVRGDRGWLWPVSLGTAAGAVLYVVAVVFAKRAALLAVGLELPAGVHLGTPPGLTAVLLALPIALALGAISGLLGDGLAQVWRRNPR